MKDAPIEGVKNAHVFYEGDKLIVWGGQDKGNRWVNDGAIYDIEKGTWKKIKGAPIERRLMGTGVYQQGDKLIIWGGANGGGSYYKDGAIYDIEKGTWQKMKDAPIEGRYANGIFIRKKLIIWGGRGKGDIRPYDPRPLDDGAIYDIEKGTWQKMKDAPIESRELHLHKEMLAGKELIIWGGGGLRGSKYKSFDNGAIYDIEKNSWRKIKESPIGTRKGHTKIFTGKELIIWSGSDGSKTLYNDGAIYDIAKGTWKIMKNAPIEGRYGPIVIQANKNTDTSTLIIIWGGRRGKSYYNDGAIYDIEKSTWKKSW